MIMMMMMMIMMMIIIIIIIVIIIILLLLLIVVLERLSCEAYSIALNKCKYKNIKRMHIGYPKQHGSKQSYSNIN